MLYYEGRMVFVLRMEGTSYIIKNADCLSFNDGRSVESVTQDQLFNASMQKHISTDANRIAVYEKILEAEIKIKKRRF